MKIQTQLPIRNFRNNKRIAIAVISFLAIGLWYLLYIGFCFQQMRYLSDKELIVAAIRHNVEKMKVDGTDESIAKFLSDHPNCCYVDKHPSTRSFLGPLGVCLGTNYSEVTLNYEQRKPHYSVEPFYEKYIPISACGVALHGEYGTSHVSQQEIN